MSTDWQLIRKLMNSTISACETMEALALAEKDRDLPTGQGPVTVWDVQESAWLYPENLSRSILCARHAAHDEPTYLPTAGRILVKVAEVCRELVDATTLDTPVTIQGTQRSMRDAVEDLDRWYQTQMIPQLTAAAGRKKPSSPS